MSVVLTTLSATSPLAALGATPGQTWAADAATTPGGYAVTITNDGDFSVALNGDTSRQSFTHSLDGESGTIYVNDQAPTFEPISGYFDYTVGLNGADIALNGVFGDFEGDTLTYALAPGSPSLPAWASIVGTTLQVGTPAGAEIALPVIRATDIAGEHTDGEIPLRSLAAQVATPGVLDETVNDAISALAAVNLNYEFGTAQYSDTVAQDHILTQSPAEGELVDLFSTVTLTASLGVEPVGMGGGFDFGFGFGFAYGAVGGGSSGSSDTIWDEIWDDIWGDIWAEPA